MLQIIAVYALVRDLSGHHGTLGSFGFFCMLFTFFFLVFMVIDVISFYAQISKREKPYESMFRLGYLGGVLPIEMCIAFVLTFPGFLQSDRQLAAH